MIRSTTVTIIAACVGLAMQANGAVANTKLAASRACLACHAVETQLLGPAFKEVSARYKSQGGAKQQLVAKIKTGGAGNWGNIPMPPHAHVSDEDLDTLVDWILGLN